MGKVISLSYDELELESVTLNFKIDSDIVNNANLNFPSEPGFVGVQRYQIFRYDETYGILYPVETTFDTVNNIVTTTTSTLGDYCVIDMDQWLYGLGIDFD